MEFIRMRNSAMKTFRQGVYRCFSSLSLSCNHVSFVGCLLCFPQRAALRTGGEGSWTFCRISFFPSRYSATSVSRYLTRSGITPGKGRAVLRSWKSDVALMRPSPRLMFRRGIGRRFVGGRWGCLELRGSWCCFHFLGMMGHDSGSSATFLGLTLSKILSLTAQTFSSDRSGSHLVLSLSALVVAVHLLPCCLAPFLVAAWLV